MRFKESIVSKLNQLISGKKMVFYGNTQFYSKFRVYMTHNKISMIGFGSDKDMFGQDYKIYTKIVELNRIPKSILFLGGGAFVGPRYFSNKYNKCKINVVEADKIIIQLINKYGKISRDRITVYNDNSRHFLERFDNKSIKYDLIFTDITTGTKYWPESKNNGRILIDKMRYTEELLTYTKEAFNLQKSMLNDDGYLVVNHIGTTRGMGSWLWKSTASILKSYFRYVQIFINYQNLSEFKNIVIIAGNSTLLSDINNIHKAIKNSILSENEKQNLLSVFVKKRNIENIINQKSLDDRDVFSSYWHIEKKNI